MKEFEKVILYFHGNLERRSRKKYHIVYWINSNNKGYITKSIKSTKCIIAEGKYIYFKIGFVLS